MNTVLGKIAIGLLALFLVVYIGYQGVRYVYNPYMSSSTVSLRPKGNCLPTCCVMRFPRAEKAYARCW